MWFMCNGKERCEKCVHMQWFLWQFGLEVFGVFEMLRNGV
jgi:hypothetical protein